MARNQSMARMKSHSPQSYGQNQGFAQGSVLGSGHGYRTEQVPMSRDKDWAETVLCPRHGIQWAVLCPEHGINGRSCAQDTESARRSYAQSRERRPGPTLIYQACRGFIRCGIKWTRINVGGQTTPDGRADYKEPDYKSTQYDWPPPSGTNIQEKIVMKKSGRSRAWMHSIRKRCGMDLDEFGASLCHMSGQDG